MVKRYIMSIGIRTCFKTFVLLAVLLCGCVTKNITHGYPEDESIVVKLKTGVTTKEGAVELLGDPSTKSTFNPNIWYYISTQMQSKGFLRPEVVRERVMQLTFSGDVLQEVTFFDNATKKQVTFHRGQSLVNGDDSGVLKDFFRNFGRFNKGSGRKSSN